MPVIQEGSVNTTNLLVPDVYVQILSPRHSLLNGVPTNILGIVGTASWGPKNAPVTISSVADFDRLFGPILEDAYDLGTAVTIAVLQMANNMRCVRVTDGTDLAATASILDDQVVPVEGVLLTAKYTGSVANTFTAKTEVGSKANTYKITIARPNYVPEIFDNIEGTGNQFWINLTSAINDGQSGVRSRSELVIATVGISTNIPEIDTYNLSGGTNGNTGVGETQLLGTDGATRTGMYALRSTQTSIAFLHGLTDTTSWAAQVAFGLSEGVYMILTGAAGDYTDIDTAIATKKAAGIDSYDAKMMLGDWCYFEDVTNNKLRLISPQSFAAGRLANLIPSQSALNKQLGGLVATESTDEKKIYSEADLDKLVRAGIDVITNPVPGGDYFALRIGHNTSSNNMIWGDNYTRMTNYLAYSMNSGMGRYVGELITEDTWSSAASTLNSFLQAMDSSIPPLIGDPSGAIPYSVQIDADNNPPDVVAKGMMIATVKVKYLSIVEVFLINLEGGQSVVIRQSTQPA